MPRKKRSDRVTIPPKIATRAGRELREQRKRRDAGIVGDGNEAAVLLGKRRAALMTEEEWSEHCRKASRAYWDSMNPKQRRIEIMRRIEARRRNRRARLRAKLGKEEE